MPIVSKNNHKHTKIIWWYDCQHDYFNTIIISSSTIFHYNDNSVKRWYPLHYCFDNLLENTFCVITCHHRQWYRLVCLQFECVLRQILIRLIIILNPIMYGSGNLATFLSIYPWPAMKFDFCKVSFGAIWICS